MTQPSFIKSIRKREEESGGPLHYRDRKDSRLTALGREVQVVFMRNRSRLKNVRKLSANSLRGRRRFLPLGAATMIAPGVFSVFIQPVLQQFSNVELNVQTIAADAGPPRFYLASMMLVFYLKGFALNLNHLTRRGKRETLQSPQ